MIAACGSTTDLKTPRFNRRLVGMAKKAFDGVEPRAGRRREVEDEPRMPREPLEHLGMLVSGVVVEDRVGHFTDGSPGLDRIQKSDEFLMAVSLHILTDHRAVENVHGGE